MSGEEIDCEKLEELVAGERAVRLVNVLSRESFERVHIPGSESIPRRELAARAPRELAKGEPIVLYCADEGCGASARAAAILVALDYKEVYDFAGGIAEWRRGGRPLNRDDGAEPAGGQSRLLAVEGPTAESFPAARGRRGDVGPTG